ncbi:hypothetical protein SAMN06295912_11478 [Sphingomonas laterariae]|uniref:Uncharacterized protein n=1 Tax=Edaphosphingomonas laterariae TaxID=861865 RepID=A0A239H0S9_9SPHN|nr:hypothetical protein [Sphingomonas laterariae]SNS74990.1 hypothetical protein SAMN06295912_11478 [Sphingomonas laterariae]
MSQPSAPRSPRATGSILAFTIIAGAVIGLFTHQPTIGLLIGAGVGTVISIAFWLKDRRG